MMWLFAILIVLALGAVAVVASGKGEPLAPAYDDRPDAAVQAHVQGGADLGGADLGGADLGGDDLRRVRFSLALRGYRMSEVDDLLSRLAGQLDAAGVTATGADSTRAEPINGAPTED